MKPSRHQIAAGVTVVALGALATVALASGSTEPNETAAAPQSAPEVRTEIVRETVHRRAKGSGSSGSGAPSSGSRTVRSSSSPSPSPSSTPATAAVAPVSSPDHQRRGRGSDDVGFDDHGGRRGEDDSDDHGGRGRGGDDDGSDDHGGDDDSGHGRGRGRGRGGDDD